MKTLEQAARQALEALEEYQNNGAPFMSCDAAVETLRQALEQPTSGDYARGYAEGFNDACKPAPTVKDCLKVEPKQEQDPYGWKVQGVALVFTGEYAEQEAKAEAKRIGGNCEAFPLYVAAQPAPQAAVEQKPVPVAWMYDWEAEGETVTNWLTSDYDEAHSPTMGCTNIRPLYTEPPKSNWQEIECPCCGDLARAFPPAPKREWVGLTDVEIGDALIDLPVLGEGYFLRIARAIEAKLKEKNA